MRWLDKMGENIKHGIRNWLSTESGDSILIRRTQDFEQSAIINRLWYNGDENELEQLYQQKAEYADKYKFWASKCTPGMEMRKIHTGLPGLIVRVLSAIVLADMNGFEFESDVHKKLWEEIADTNKFTNLIEDAVKEMLFIGDGAFRISIDTELQQYPILEWVSGENIEIVRNRGRVREVIFKTEHMEDHKRYILNERYGYGYIINELYQNDSQVPLERVKALAGLKDTQFDSSVILAVPFMAYKSAKYKGRGGSIYDGKLGSFDALDEAWSQWMDALRAGRARTYIPELFAPHDPKTGKIAKPNPFDNRFFAGSDDMSEGGKNEIKVNQPAIPHDSYAATYCTALDLCLQGVISPSTLGIDVKKLDNAEAQREKEKATLYTRNAIIEALQDILPELVGAAINADNLLHKKAIEEVDVNIPFGEYANPSFESQVETVGKGKSQGIMSIEAAVEELYGDSKDEAWKKEEVARLKAEQGIAEMEEPAVNQSAGSFQMNVKGEALDGSEGGKQNVPDEPEGVPGAPAGGK